MSPQHARILRSKVRLRILCGSQHLHILAHEYVRCNIFDRTLCGSQHLHIATINTPTAILEGIEDDYQVESGLSSVSLWQTALDLICNAILLNWLALEFHKSENSYNFSFSM